VSTPATSDHRQTLRAIAHDLSSPIGFVSSNVTTLATYVSGLLDIIAAYEAIAPSMADADALERVHAVKVAADLEFVREDAPVLLKESEEGLARMRALIIDLKEFARRE